MNVAKETAASQLIQLVGMPNMICSLRNADAIAVRCLFSTMRQQVVVAATTRWRVALVLKQDL